VDERRGKRKERVLASDTTGAGELRKELGLLSVFSIAAGAMISSGIFVLPGLAFANAGPAVILSYGLASLFMIPTMFSQAELATAMPRSGGSYFYVERSLGPLVGTVAGFSMWLSLSLKIAFALVGIGAVAAAVFPMIGEWGVKGVAIGACIVFATINILGTRHTGRLQGAMVLALLGILLLYVVSAGRLAESEQYVPFLPETGWRTVFAVAGMVFVSYGGLTKVVDVAGEVRKPSVNIPAGMFMAFGVVSVIYVLAVFATVGAVAPEELTGSLVPLTLGAARALGRPGAVILGAGALLAFCTTANAGILSAARSPLAMSRDGLAPEFLSKTSARFGTPHVAIAITALLISLVLAALSVETLVKTASTVMILMFMLANLSVVIMRQSGIQNYRPTFRAPLYPWLQIAAILLYGFLIVEMGLVPLALSAGFALLAAVWYTLYVHRHIDRESALVYMVKNIVAPRMTRSNLEDELKQITIERDEIVMDRFDKLVSDAVILDVAGTMQAKEFFQSAADALSRRIGVESKRLYDEFLKREMESSTVVRPGLAIPHVVIDGEGVFEMAIVRCRGGIVFSPLNPPVTTAFVLIGSADERNFHLRALMNIAHIIQEHDFADRWKKAHGPEQLRDVVLLSRRKREKPS